MKNSTLAPIFFLFEQSEKWFSETKLKLFTTAIMQTLYL